MSPGRGRGCWNGAVRNRIQRTPSTPCQWHCPTRAFDSDSLGPVVSSVSCAPDGAETHTKYCSRHRHVHAFSHTCGIGSPNVYGCQDRFCAVIFNRNLDRAFAYGYCVAATPAIDPEQVQNEPKWTDACACMHARLYATAACLSNSTRACVCVQPPGGLYRSLRGMAPSLRGARAARTVRLRAAARRLTRSLATSPHHAVPHARSCANASVCGGLSL
jgi:hypothetical protein